MKNLIVGTAGHVDHGKTALIRYLTGTDTDRLQEEKKRGISIDIGFASLRLDGELTLGIIDVPGHERFLKNMLAGTGGIDLVMLVIAADEGIMPQTREHFEMLQCLGIKKGIVVLNKTDRVDSEWLMLIEDDVREWLSDTFLADAPICKVSALTGAGMDDLRQGLREAAEKITERDSSAPFRLWIDRAFNLRGQGLIVTGSVLSGKVRPGGAVRVYPSATPGKVREIETHNQSVTVVGAGQRASLKLTGLSLGEVGRGMFLSEDGVAQTSQIWDAAIQWKNLYPSGTRIRFHIGTGEFIGRMSYMKKGSPAELVRLHLETPVSGGPGDKGLLRRYSPQDLIGGVTLLCPAARNHKRDNQLHQLKAGLEQQNRTAVMMSLLIMAKDPPTEKEWIQMAGYYNEQESGKAVRQLLESGKVKKAGSCFVAAEELARLQESMVTVLVNFHRQQPKEPGISREILRQKITLPDSLADWFLQDAQHNKLVMIRDEFIALPTHAKSHVQNAAQLRAIFEAVIDPKELVDVTPQWLAEKIQRQLPEVKPFFDTLTREGLLVRIAGVHVYRKTIQYIGAVIQAHFATRSTLSVGEFRDLLHTSRRLAIPVLEYFDANKYTTRKDDVRLPGPNLTNLSE